MHAGNNEHEKYYFVADEVIFQVTHPDLDEPELREELIPAINKFLSARGNDPTPEERYWRRSLEFREPDSKIIRFSPSTRCPELEPFSLVSLKFKAGKHAAGDLSPNHVLNLLSDAYAELGDRLGRPSRGEGGEASPTRSGVPLDGTSDKILLNAIAPNSLSRGLDHGKGMPGPGSIPARRNSPTVDQRKFVLKGKYPFKGWSDFRMPGAEIAILDTAMPLDKFDGFPDPIPGIFNTNVEVILYPHNDFAVNGDPSKSIFDDYTKPHKHDDLIEDHHHHHYNLQDHGTFIVSLIRAITPSTKVYLHQVLNQYGVGSFMTISQGIQDAVKRSAEHATPLIINCSLMLEHEMPPATGTQLDDEHTKETLMSPMQQVFEWAAGCKDVVIVASAGNDGDPDSMDSQDERADPRYPAAFERVLSVTALPKGHPRDSDKKYRVSTYSNRAYAEGSSQDKIRRSFAIFGGDLFEDTTAPLGGALGVYVGKIPRQEPDGTFVPPEQLNLNETGWVQWSGTSFAAPVVAALLAAKDEELFADNINMPITEPKDPERPYRTIDDENVIIIRQG